MPIRCQGLDLNHILSPLQFAIKNFPCSYLGMPLSLRSLRKIDFQALLDKIDALLAAWKGSMISREGRLVLKSRPLFGCNIYDDCPQVSCLGPGENRATLSCMVLAWRRHLPRRALPCSVGNGMQA
jgi:hypothetical protein